MKLNTFFATIVFLLVQSIFGFFQYQNFLPLRNLEPSPSPSPSPSFSSTPLSSDGLGQFETWLDSQQNSTIHSILSNILHNGVIIASPSRTHPNYYYQWIRDSALTIKTLISFLQSSPQKYNETIVSHIDQYISNSFVLQRTDNPSGQFDDDLKSLGEPKFNIDMTAFEQPWGRPQRDGPALRTLAILQYLDYLNSTNIHAKEASYSKKIYDKIVKIDLYYICKYWSFQDGFDIWEEARGRQFFTSLVQLKALEMAIHWSTWFNDDDDFKTHIKTNYDTLKHDIETKAGFIQDENNISHIIEIPNLLAPDNQHRSGLDIATVLAIIHTNTNSLSSEHVTPFNAFNTSNHYVLNSLALLIKDMKQRYLINKSHWGVALGRYPEDKYNGYDSASLGNPWFLATSAAAEFIYLFIYQITPTNGDVYNFTITDSNRLLFEPILKSKTPGGNITLTYGSKEYFTFIRKLLEYADSFLMVVKTHMDNEGNLSEQFNRNNGFMQGAEKLTWSYCALWDAIYWRSQVLSKLS